jgi:hypothetical protein
MSGRTVFKLSLAALLASVFANVNAAQAPANDPPTPETAPKPREKVSKSDPHVRMITLKECIEIALEQGNTDVKTPSMHVFNSELQQIKPTGGSKRQGLLSQRLQLDVQINYLLVNVEVSYWNLFSAYQNLKAQEEGLRNAFNLHRFVDTRATVGSDTTQNLDQARAQLERFRRMVIDARAQVQESERQLRGQLGMKNDDGKLLVPSDEPSFEFSQPDFQIAVDEALAYRPEIVQCRQDLKAQKLNLVLQKNLEKSDLVSAAESLKVSYSQLRDTELKVMEYLVHQYRQMIQTHADIAPARAERKALQTYTAKMDLLIALGKWNSQDFLNYFTMQQQLATAIATENQAIANHRIALATYEFAKGTIQEYHKFPTGR